MNDEKRASVMRRREQRLHISSSCRGCPACWLGVGPPQHGIGCACHESPGLRRRPPERRSPWHQSLTTAPNLYPLTRVVWQELPSPYSRRSENAQRSRPIVRDRNQRQERGDRQ